MKFHLLSHLPSTLVRFFYDFKSDDCTFDDENNFLNSSHSIICLVCFHISVMCLIMIPSNEIRCILIVMYCRSESGSQQNEKPSRHFVRFN